MEIWWAVLDEDLTLLTDVEVNGHCFGPKPYPSSCWWRYTLQIHKYFCWSKGVAADSFHPVLNQVPNADLIFFINDVFIVPRVFVTFLSTLSQVVMINDFITKWHGFTCTKIGLRSGLREILLKSEQSTNSICSLPSSAQKAFNHTHFPFSFPCWQASRT